MTDAASLKLQKIALLEKKLELKEGLPHLHGFPFYKWAREFFESRAKDNLLCAANQISKSSTQIRKCIHWATAPSIWKGLWLTRPLVFWYLYPTASVANIEFEKKWVPEFLPRGKFKDHPIYGWKDEWHHGDLVAIHFNSGVSVYFKSYAQNVSHLQTGTVHAIFADEELPEEIYQEVNFRRSATDGYFHLVFTATLGQEMWRRAIEEKGKDELFTDAFKRQVTMWDCVTYEDGTPSHWTPERIKRVEASCGTEAERLKRVYGRFVVDENLKYPSFERSFNVRPAHPLPKDWKIYAGVDVGSGGEKGHPAAICFVAVSPDYTKGRVFRGWRGDGVQTTASDVLTKFQLLRGELVMTGQFYDWQAKDFYTIASRLGEPFAPAEKSHEIGEQMLNVLFKSGMLVIYDHEELRPLVQELCSLRSSTAKTRARDDFIDAMRYAVTRIPWNWTAIGQNERAKGEVPKQFGGMREVDQERYERALQPVDEQAALMIDDEIESWNELYDTSD